MYSMCGPCWSTTHCRRRLHSLMLSSVKRCDRARHSSTIAFCSVSCIRMACCYRFYVELFWSTVRLFCKQGVSLIFYDYPPVLDVAPSIAFLCYAFIKIKLASRHLLLYVVYRCQKLFNFVDACDCYKQKWKLAPFNLAQPVYTE